ncbi:hypothetical protein LINPERPRIM_LOCUS10977, partial [Linum perenne]
ARHQLGNLFSAFFGHEDRETKKKGLIPNSGGKEGQRRGLVHTAFGRSRKVGTTGVSELGGQQLR